MVLQQEHGGVKEDLFQLHCYFHPISEELQQTLLRMEFFVLRQVHRQPLGRAQ